MSTQTISMTQDCWKLFLEERTDVPQDLVWQDVNQDGYLDFDTEIMQPSIWKMLGAGHIWTNSYELATEAARSRIIELMSATHFQCSPQRILPTAEQEIKYAPDSLVSISNDRMLLIVHAESSFDREGTAKEGANQQLQKADKEDIPIVALNNFPQFSYLDSDIALDHKIFSNAGENALVFSGQELVLAGGSMNACWAQALYDITRHSSSDSLTVEIPMNAAYIASPSRGPYEIHRPPSWGDRGWVTNLAEYLSYPEYTTTDKESWAKLKTYARIIQTHLPHEWGVSVYLQNTDGGSQSWEVPHQDSAPKKMTLKFIQ